MTAVAWHPWPAERPEASGRYRVKTEGGKVDIYYWRTDWRESVKAVVWTGVIEWQPEGMMA